MPLHEELSDLVSALENVHPSNGVFIRRDKVVAALNHLLAADRISINAKTNSGQRVSTKEKAK